MAASLVWSQPQLWDNNLSIARGCVLRRTGGNVQEGHRSGFSKKKNRAKNICLKKNGLSLRPQVFDASHTSVRLKEKSVLSLVSVVSVCLSECVYVCIFVVCCLFVCC